MMWMKMIFNRKKGNLDDFTGYTRIETVCGCEIWVYLMHLDDKYRTSVTEGQLCKYHEDVTKEQYIEKMKEDMNKGYEGNFRLSRRP